MAYLAEVNATWPENRWGGKCNSGGVMLRMWGLVPFFKCGRQNLVLPSTIKSISRNKFGFHVGVSWLWLLWIVNLHKESPTNYDVVHKVKILYGCLSSTSQVYGRCIVDNNIYSSKCFDSWCYSILDLVFAPDIHNTWKTLSSSSSDCDWIFLYYSKEINVCIKKNVIFDSGALLSSAAVYIVPGSFGCTSAVLAAITILAPSLAALRAIALPIPRLAPVINNVRPANFLNIYTYIITY